MFHKADRKGQQQQRQYTSCSQSDYNLTSLSPSLTLLLLVERAGEASSVICINAFSSAHYVYRQAVVQKHISPSLRSRLTDTNGRSVGRCCAACSSSGQSFCNPSNGRACTRDGESRVTSGGQMSPRTRRTGGQGDGGGAGAGIATGRQAIHVVRLRPLIVHSE